MKKGTYTQRPALNARVELLGSEAPRKSTRQYIAHEAEPGGVRSVPTQFLEHLVAVGAAQASIQCTADLCEVCL